MKINEIFYSLQGEGINTGVPAVFIRFSGCNLRCPFCDTQHETGTHMTVEEVIAEVRRYPAPIVVLTGGEPSLFITSEFVDRLKTETNKRVCIETNGTHQLPDNIDWVTLSPKDQFTDIATGSVVLSHCDELKLVYPSHPEAYDHINATHRLLQPCDTGNEVRNREITQSAIEYCLTHTQWRLCLQTHKIVDVK